MRHPLSIAIWHACVGLEHIDPASNRYRTYRLELSRDLYGRSVLIVPSQ